MGEKRWTRWRRGHSEAECRNRDHRRKMSTSTVVRGEESEEEDDCAPPPEPQQASVVHSANVTDATAAALIPDVESKQPRTVVEMKPQTPLQKRLGEKREALRASLARRLGSMLNGVRNDLEGNAASLDKSLEVVQDVNHNMRAVNHDIGLACERMQAMGSGIAILRRPS